MVLVATGCSGSGPTTIADVDPTTSAASSADRAGGTADDDPTDSSAGDDDARAVLVESFSGSGALTRSTTDLAWSEPVGEWTVTDGGLMHTSLVGPAASVAVTETGSANGLVQLSFTTPADWAGLTFRYADPTNYWAIVGAPSFGTWNLLKVVDGESFDVGNVGAAPVAPGTIVGVFLDGDVISVAINGQTLLTVVDDTHRFASAAGSFAGQDTASLAVWDDLVVVPAVDAEATAAAVAEPPPAPTAVPTASRILEGLELPDPDELTEDGTPVEGPDDS